ncbi:sigma-70 family RNA polymerase sigma factor [Thermomonas sp.]|uniref:RNA polymerase sigma factor n=1 Tax=Thermomonas sp. TaxID=1971895 RepID=UPI002489786A|nr:sigma-70 family RNA polymerase sigma factor [Thermomonas sp.]MDI1253942.1 sigma-70 family RNA polymerase sigma factor [Thermomonas sp.]
MNASESHRTFSELLQRHAGIVFKVANTYARGNDDRADLAQEIAAQLWRAWPKYDSTRNVTTWMYRIALNVAISHVRSNSVRLRHDAIPLDDDLHDIADGNAADPETEQHLRLLQQFIARQEPLDRALLLLYLEERNQSEIADILGISESNVSTKIGRLKQRIRNEL